MSLLLHGDCLEQMKGIDTNSVDFIFCDLPYGQTSCKWDVIIPWEPFWNEILRVKKINTPIFFTTTTKFGVELINNAPKKCPFRYDLVWVKSAPAGFLSAKKMPMRKHEMVYCFYEKLPFYDLSSHKHKFIKQDNPDIKLEEAKINSENYGTDNRKNPLKQMGSQTGNKGYDTPLPTSVVKEVKSENNYHNQKVHHYTDENGNRLKEDCQGSKYDPPLPTSVVKEQEGTIYGDLPTTDSYAEGVGLGKKGHEPRYDPPLPNSLLEIKSTRGKHSTEKPVALMEWLLKYYSKEGDVVLDPTMGSGSTGVACKNMNRNFIGIEKDDEIYEVAVNRIQN
jgi:DNA modification methylase